MWFSLQAPVFFFKIWTPGSPWNLGEFFKSTSGNLSYSSSRQSIFGAPVLSAFKTFLILSRHYSKAFRTCSSTWAVVDVYPHLQTSLRRHTTCSPSPTPTLVGYVGPMLSKLRLGPTVAVQVGNVHPIRVATAGLWMQVSFGFCCHCWIPFYSS